MSSDRQCGFHVAGVKFPNLLRLPDRNLIGLFVSTKLSSKKPWHSTCHPHGRAVVRFGAIYFVGWKVTAQYCSS